MARIMKCVVALSGIALAWTAQGQQAVYSQVTLLANGTQLVVSKTDGTRLSAPKFDDQDAFDKPEISSNGRYVGWLELHPNTGASYSMPLRVDVLDSSSRVHRLGQGDFGMVFGWCFGEDGKTVVYTYSFPHGITSQGFDMRRIADNKRIRRVLMQPPESNDTEQVRDAAPSWGRCAWDSARGDDKQRRP